MINDLIGQVIASDPDDGQILTYSIIQGNESGMFAMNSLNGEIYANTDINLIPDQSIVLEVEVTDNADNPLSSSASITINISGLDNEQTSDITAPVISSFDIPSTSTSLTVAVLSWGCSDDQSVTGYKLTETSAAPSASDTGWESSKASSYTFSEAGNKVLYAWAKDAAGNVSSPVYDLVTITLSERSDTLYVDSVEYVTICEGENYRGWTEPGVYERTVTTDTTLQTTGTNIIINGDFSSGTDGWSSWGATGYSLDLTANGQEYISSPASLQVECISTGTSIGSLQLIKKGELTIEAGKEYQLAFYARATTEFAIGALYIHKATSPYTNYGTFEVSRPVISTTWAEHKIKFTATHSATDASFRIYLGNSLPAGQSLYLDDISFSENSANYCTIIQTITTYLTVNPILYSSEVITITKGEEYMGWTKSGTYQRTLTSSTGCDSIVTTELTVIPGNGRNKSADPFIADAHSMIPDSTFDNRSNGDLLLYPNPARSYINIAYNTLPGLNTKIEIIDIHGRVMLTREIHSTLTRLTIDELTSGIYYLRSIEGQKQMMVRKFIKH
jgi:hypothetical protein